MGDYIEYTLKSIVNQEYENYEIIIIDGGSTDHTIPIINKYHSYISIIISEKDRSMYDAINKGMNKATGEIVTWLNADDIYFPWTLKYVSMIFTKFKSIQWICGIPAFLNKEGLLTNIYTHASAKPSEYIKKGWFRKDIFGFLQQEGIFMRKEMYTLAGGLNLNLKYAADFELWTRLSRNNELVSVNIPLAAFRKRKNSLSISCWDKYSEEVELVIAGETKYPNFLWKLSNSFIYKQILRLLTFKRSGIIYYSIVNDQIVYIKSRRSLSSNTITSLILQAIK